MCRRLPDHGTRRLLNYPQLAREVLGSLDLDQKAALTAGDAIFSVAGIDSAGIPPLFMTDGPNGARGPATPRRRRRAHDLRPVRRRPGRHLGPVVARGGGGTLGREARAKAAGCCWRPPSTSIARRWRAATSSATPRTRCCRASRRAAFIRGVQSQGVVTTVKHFVGNEAEIER